MNLEAARKQRKQYQKDIVDMGYDDQIEAVILENSSEVLMVHKKKACKGGICSIHGRTDHKMRSFPQHWRGDRGIMERICSHGVGHPDTDDIRIRTEPGEDLHGCDGCCS